MMFSKKFTYLYLIFIVAILISSSGFCFDISKNDFQSSFLSNPNIVRNKIKDLFNNFNLNIFKHFRENQNEISLDVYDGYTLFGPEYSRYTFLINNNKRIVHFWKSDYTDCLGNYLTEDGYFIRMCLPRANPTFLSGGVSGRVEKFDNESNLIWEFEYTNDQYCLHHDIEPLPNGNILMIAWEYKTIDEAINAGRDPGKLSGALWPDHIIEVEPIGFSGYDIVWEWHAWDHLIQDFDPSKDNYGDVGEHPELIDINYGPNTRDWTHFNSLDYNEEFDQILISAHNFNEIWVIDHSTTSSEAAGHTGGNSGKGGDILYRWGNPIAYRAGDIIDQKFIGQHYAQWVMKGCPGEGNILVFNNGGRNRFYSSVDEIIPPIDENGNYSYTTGMAYGPEEQIWVYTTDIPSDLFSMIMSSAQRLPNGNTLICSANQGWILEVTYDKEIVWEYTNIFPTPIANGLFMAYRYSVNYSGIPENQNFNTRMEQMNGFYGQFKVKLSRLFNQI